MPVTHRARSPSLVSLVSLVILVIAMVSSPAAANVGPRSRGGERAGEPVGIVDLAIAREELVIDLRPLAEEQGLVKVAATYHLDNGGADKPLDLVFATGSPTSAFFVTLDGKPVASRPIIAQLPDSWKPPATTPLADGGELQYELRRDATPIGFQLVVPPGRHDLAIAYNADAIRYHHGDPTLLYQFGYVLSPAKSWARFGGLDLTVHVPPGWRVAITPSLTREGDTLRGTFATVPGDAVAITVQAPTGAYALIAAIGKALFVLVTFGGAFAVGLVASRRSRRRRDAGQPAKRRGGIDGLVWGVAFVAAGVFALAAPDLALPSGQADHYGYGRGLAYVLLVVASVVVIVIGALVSFLVTRRVHRRATGA